MILFFVVPLQFSQPHSLGYGTYRRKNQGKTKRLVWSSSVRTTKKTPGVLALEVNQSRSTTTRCSGRTQWRTFKKSERSILLNLADSWVCSLLFFAVGVVLRGGAILFCQRKAKKRVSQDSRILRDPKCDDLFLFWNKKSCQSRSLVKERPKRF